MIQTEIKNLEAGERKILERLLQEEFYEPLFKIRNAGQAVGFVFLLGLFALIGYIAATLLTLLIFFMSKILPAFAPIAAPSAVRVILAAGALGGLVGIPFWLWKRQRSARHSRRELFEKDLKEGKVEQLHVKASGVVRCEALEQGSFLPPAFFIRVSDSELLFLQGNYLKQPVKSGHFPSTEFKFVRGLHSKQILNLESLGKPLALTAHDLDLTEESHALPQDGSLISAKFQTLEQVLRKKRP